MLTISTLANHLAYSKSRGIGLILCNYSCVDTVRLYSAGTVPLWEPERKEVARMQSIDYWQVGAESDAMVQVNGFHSSFVRFAEEIVCELHTGLRAVSAALIYCSSKIRC